MKRSRKLIVLLTLLSYLAASSVASAHGFMSLKQKPTNFVASEMMVMSESENMDCHSLQAPSGEKSNSTTCKIFCSVMAQAMTETNFSVNLDTEPLAAVLSFNASVLTRQLAVEIHPPR